jgi:hypothetical protein
MDDPVLQLIRGSALFQALTAAANRVVAAMGASTVVRLIRGCVHQMSRLELEVRIRSAGWLILAAAATHEGLAMAVSRGPRPLPARGLSALAAAAAVVVIAAATHVAAAWRTKTRGLAGARSDQHG